MKHVLELMDTTGHTTIEWDPNNEQEVEVARAAFEEATSRGYRAFQTSENGRRLDNFDPSAQRMVMVPQLRGG